MSPEAGTMLLDNILPILRAAVPRAVKPVGAEDHAEIVQDTLAMAASMVESAERNGKKLISNSIAFFAIMAAKSGRRSTYAGRTDAMSAAARLDGHSMTESLEAPLSDDDDDSPSLGDMQADKHDDPATYSARALDWSELLVGLDARSAAVLVGTAQGMMNMDIAKALLVSPPRVVQLKRQIADKIRQAWGDNAMVDAGNKPAWRMAMRGQ